MKPLRVTVVEDQPLAREHLTALLNRQPGVTVVGECANGADALTRIPELAPDLVFLDVQMPELSGFDVIDALGEQMPPVVFVTAFDHYALKAFEVHAFDYLLKPFGEERLAAVVARVRKFVEQAQTDRPAGQRFAGLLSDPPIAAARERVVLRAGGRIQFVKREEIEWAEAEGNYAVVHTPLAVHRVRQTMSELERNLGPGFTRIHRSTIVNLHRVKELQIAGHGEYDVVMQRGERLRVTRFHLPDLDRRLREL